MYALRTSAYIWTDPTLQKMDRKLTRLGVTLIDCPWETFEYLEDDPDHFTHAGFLQFSDWLVQMLINREILSVLIMSDSTIDFWNYNDEGRRSGRAHRHLYCKMREKGIEGRLDTVCGSGYVCEPTFAQRYSKCDYSECLVIGGWNDVGSTFLMQAVVDFWKH